MAEPRIFLSYAHADRAIAERLRASLEKRGCVVYDPAHNGTPVNGFEARVEEAASASDHFVLLFGKHRDRDRAQELEWQVALEASWADPSKKMIPVLLGNAELPNFVRGAAATGRTDLGLHVHGLREVDRAAEVIATNARGAFPDPRASRGIGGERMSRRTDDEPKPAGYSMDESESSDALVFAVEPATGEELSVRLAEIERYADELEL